MSHWPQARGANRLISLAAAILAVLAALGTLFAHHRSITALASKNQAILLQSRATDTYNAYEAKQIRFNIYRALISTDLVRDAKIRKQLEGAAATETESAPSVLEQAKLLERQAASEDERSQSVMKSYEMLQYAAASFQIAIVLVSISALVAARYLLPIVGILGTLGLALLAMGLAQGG
ncbi:MAG: DUF4337 family protein [Candidatus Eremiobacteraeota bacterium]|nr:DUF4337 family protein [Candidatus Eremiobacteraeota bacterium]MBV9057173.1 DUF4337 family protein [Candidatus Eremiobacteraeota bacterium]MBV9700561.1 DUF4337 family protein [Candidatus Eremiobacteraeota bacterium]